MRLVGNSYAVSIPKEIVSFINQINNEMNKNTRMMDDMVRLCFEDFGKVSLNFGEKCTKSLEIARNRTCAYSRSSTSLSGGNLVDGLPPARVWSFRGSATIDKKDEKSICFKLFWK